MTKTIIYHVTQKYGTDKYNMSYIMGYIFRETLFSNKALTRS